MSANNQTPKLVCIAPLAAAETICVTGEVTLIDKNPAIQIRNPNSPYGTSASKTEEWYHILSVGVK